MHSTTEILIDRLAKAYTRHLDAGQRRDEARATFSVQCRAMLTDMTEAQRRTFESLFGQLVDNIDPPQTLASIGSLQ